MEERAAAPPHIVLSHVTKRYTTAQRGELLALRDVSFEAGRGEFISIVGPSGCGKSTLLYIVAGLLEASGGSVEVDGKAVDGPSPERGVVLQNFSIFPWRRVADNVVYGPQMRGVSKAERRRLAHKYLELVGLEDFADYYPRELSGGMKQRVAIAQMLACNPGIFLMDEPRSCRISSCASGSATARRCCSSPTASTRRCCCPTASSSWEPGPDG